MRKNHVLFSLLVAGLIGLGATGCSKDSSPSYGMSPAPTPKPQPNTVVISNYAFGPTSMTVTKGTTVTWQNDDAVAHTSTSNTGAWDTGNISAGGSATTTFSTAGTFAYHCTYHTMMTGTIVVQ